MRRLLTVLNLRRHIEDELAAHIEEKIADLVDSGVPLAEAQLRARREFGMPALIAEDSRRSLGWTWLDNLAQDLRYAFRMLRRSPGFTGVAVLSLALGIGANTAIFGLLDAIAWKMLPIRDPQGLWAPGHGGREKVISTGYAWSYPLYELWRDHNRSFESLAAAGTFSWKDKSTASDDARHQGQLASPNFFDVLGVRAMLGRTFAATDTAVAVVSYNYWRRALHGDDAVLGRALNVNGAFLTVIGVTPPEFFGIQIGSSPDVFVPILQQRLVNPPDDLIQDPPRGSTSWITVMGRLRPGVLPGQAKADLAPLLDQYNMLRMSAADRARYLAQNPASATFRLEPASRGFSGLRDRFSEPLRVLLVLVGIVLLIACANVANLLLARGNSRQKEIAVRLAIGAGRSRILRQLLTESLLLSLAGGGLGLAFALWSSRMLIGMLGQGLTPLALEVTPDPRVLGFTLGVSLLTSLLFGLAPALRATRLSVSGALGKSRPTGRFTRFELSKLVVVIEMALSVPLLIGAGLFIGTLRNLATMDAGFSRQNVLQIRINIDAVRSPRTQWSAVYDRIADSVAVVPGVVASSLVDRGLIEGGSTRSGPLNVPGHQFHADDERSLSETRIDADYFAAAGIPLRAGRPFTAREGSPAAQIAIVNEAFVRRYLGIGNAIGKRFGLGDAADIEIVGVVADAKYDDLRQDSAPMAYYPWKQGGISRLNSVIVRTQGDPAVMTPALRAAIGAVHPELFRSARTLSSQIDDSLLRERLLASLSGFFGGLALLLACIGLYGVMAYAVSRRTAEIGVRMALGAVPGDVIRLVLRETLLLSVAGIAIGIPIALWLTRLTASLLFQVKPNDPDVIALAVSCLLGVCALAGWLPARRAARVDPIIALRYE